MYEVDMIFFLKKVCLYSFETVNEICFLKQDKKLQQIFLISTRDNIGQFLRVVAQFSMIFD